jgi:hypothetical protein
MSGRKIERLLLLSSPSGIAQPPHRQTALEDPLSRLVSERSSVGRVQAAPETGD